MNDTFLLSVLPMSMPMPNILLPSVCCRSWINDWIDWRSKCRTYTGTWRRNGVAHTRRTRLAPKRLFAKDFSWRNFSIVAKVKWRELKNFLNLPGMNTWDKFGLNKKSFKHKYVKMYSYSFVLSRLETFPLVRREFTNLLSSQRHPSVLFGLQAHFLFTLRTT